MSWSIAKNSRDKAAMTSQLLSLSYRVERQSLQFCFVIPLVCALRYILRLTIFTYFVGMLIQTQHDLRPAIAHSSFTEMKCSYRTYNYWIQFCWSENVGYNEDYNVHTITRSVTILYQLAQLIEWLRTD